MYLLLCTSLRDRNVLVPLSVPELSIFQYFQPMKSAAPLYNVCSGVSTALFQVSSRIDGLINHITLIIK